MSLALCSPLAGCENKFDLGRVVSVAGLAANRDDENGEEFSASVGFGIVVADAENIEPTSGFFVSPFVAGGSVVALKAVKPLKPLKTLGAGLSSSCTAVLLNAPKTPRPADSPPAAPRRLPISFFLFLILFN